MLEVINRLARRNGFTHGHSRIFNQTKLNFTEQQRLVKNITQRKEPFLYDRHVHMIDFARFVSEGFRMARILYMNHVQWRAVLTSHSP